MVCLFALAACDNEKQASAEMGAMPKQTIDAATAEINAASAAAEERLKAVESLDVAEETQR